MLRNEDGRPERKIDTRLFGGSVEEGGSSQSSWLRRGELNEILVLKTEGSRAGRN